jgi:hypothetical protein
VYQPQAGYPQTLRQGLQASTRVPGAVAAGGKQVTRQQAERAVPGLTPAPDQPLPTGQLFDEVKYDPNSTVGARFLNRQLPRIVPPTTEKPSGNPSLNDQNQKKE